MPSGPPCESSSLLLHGGGWGLLQKPESKFLGSGCAVVGIKLKGAWRWCGWGAKASFRGVALFVFHALNVVVAIDGAISVALLLAGLTIMSVTTLIARLVLSSWGCLLLTAYFGGAVVCLVMATCDELVLLGPIAVLAVLFMFGLSWVLPVFIAIFVMVWCARADARLASTFEPAIQSGRGISGNFRDGFVVDCSRICPTDRECMTSGICLGNNEKAVVLYFAVRKVVVGALSAVIAVFTAIQPAAAFLGGGGAPFLVNLVTFDESPILFAVVVSSCWLIGVAGLLNAARLSVKWTEAYADDLNYYWQP